MSKDNRGGYRPGAGRKPETLSVRQVKAMLSAAKARAKAEGRTIDEAEQNGIGTTDGNPNNRITTTKVNGVVVKHLPETREMLSDGDRFVAFELVGVTNEERARLYSMRIRGATP